MEQLYSQIFFARKELHYEDREDIREKALKEVNIFLYKHECLDMINIIEYWNEEEDSLRLIVYFKGYV